MVNFNYEKLAMFFSLALVLVILNTSLVSAQVNCSITLSSDSNDTINDADDGDTVCVGEYFLNSELVINLSDLTIVPHPDGSSLNLNFSDDSSMRIDGNNIVIEGLLISDTQRHGVVITGDNVTYRNNRILRSGGYSGANNFHGVNLGGSGTVTISFSMKRYPGIGVWVRGNDVTVENNEVFDSGWHGITVTGDRAIIRNNTVHYNGINSWGEKGSGIVVQASSGSLVEENTVSYNKKDGIVVVNSPDTIVRNNFVHNNERRGIHIRTSSDFVNISRNVAEDNVMQGIFVNNSQNTLLFDNIATGNGMRWISHRRPKEGRGIEVHNSQNITLEENNVSLNAGYGVRTLDTQANIIDNSITENGRALYSRSQHGFFGIRMENSSDSILLGNYLRDSARTNIYIQDSFNLNISQNIISDPGIPGRGLHLRNSSGIIKNNSAIRESLGGGRDGFTISDSHQGVVIEDNLMQTRYLRVFRSSNVSIENNAMRGVSLSNTEDLEISNNTIKNWITSEPSGIQMRNSEDITIINNVIEGFIRGIRIYDMISGDEVTDINITGNTIQDNRHGLNVDGNITNIMLRENSIIGEFRSTGVGIGVTAIDVSNDVDAQYNFWGSLDGPEGINGSLANGSGNAVTQNVLFDNWYPTQIVNITAIYNPITETEPITVEVNVTNAGSSSQSIDVYLSYKGEVVATNTSSSLAPDNSELLNLTWTTQRGDASDEDELVVSTGEGFQSSSNVTTIREFQEVEAVISIEYHTALSYLVEGHNVTFHANDSLVSPGEIVAWNWSVSCDAVNCSEGMEGNDTHTFTLEDLAPGNLTVSLEVESLQDGDPYYDSTSRTVEVYEIEQPEILPPDDLEIIVHTDRVVAGKPVNLSLYTEDESVNLDNVKWCFGAECTVGQKITHTFETSGVESLGIGIWDIGNKFITPFPEIMLKNITVNPTAPYIESLEFTVDNTLVTQGDEVTFTIDVVNNGTAPLLLGFNMLANGTPQQIDRVSAEPGETQFEYVWSSDDLGAYNFTVIPQISINGGMLATQEDAVVTQGTVFVVDPITVVVTDKPEVHAVETDLDLINDLYYAKNETITVSANITSLETLEEVTATIFSETQSFRLDQLMSGNGNNWTAQFAVDDFVDDGTYTIEVVARNSYGFSNTNESNYSVIIDREAPRLTSVIENVTDGTGTLLITSNKNLSEDPIVQFRGSTLSVDSKASGDDLFVWNATIDFTGDGVYTAQVNGSSLAGYKATSEVSITYIESLSIDNNNTAFFVNNDTGLIIKLYLDPSFSGDAFMALSQDTGHFDSITGEYSVGFLTANLAEDLYNNLINATIALPVSDNLPANISKDAVTLQRYSTRTASLVDDSGDDVQVNSSVWAPLSTSILNFSTEPYEDQEYWVATVENFSTYGFVAEDTTPPTIENMYPETDIVSDQDSEAITIEFEYSDDISGIDVPSIQLKINGVDVTDTVDTSVTSSKTTHEIEIEKGTVYHVEFFVADNNNNPKEVELQFELVDEAETSDGATGNGGAGGNGVAPAPEDEEEKKADTALIDGNVFKLTVDDTILFTLTADRVPSDQRDHMVRLNNFNETYAQVTINSEPINLTLEKDVDYEVDVIGDGVNDILIRYEGTESSDVARIFLQEIATEYIADEPDVIDEEREDISDVIEAESRSWLWIVAVIALLIVGGLFLFFRRK